MQRSSVYDAHSVASNLHSYVIADNDSIDGVNAGVFGQFQVVADPIDAGLQSWRSSLYPQSGAGPVSSFFQRLVSYDSAPWIHASVAALGLLLELSPEPLGSSASLVWVPFFVLLLALQFYVFGCFYVLIDRSILWKVVWTFDFFILLIVSLMWQGLEVATFWLDPDRPEISVCIVFTYVRVVAAAILLGILTSTDLMPFLQRGTVTMLFVGLWAWIFWCMVVHVTDPISPDYYRCTSTGLRHDQCVSFYWLIRLAVFEICMFGFHFVWRMYRVPNALSIYRPFLRLMVQFGPAHPLKLYGPVEPEPRAHTNTPQSRPTPGGSSNSPFERGTFRLPIASSGGSDLRSPEMYLPQADSVDGWRPSSSRAFAVPMEEKHSPVSSSSPSDLGGIDTVKSTATTGPSMPSLSRSDRSLYEQKENASLLDSTRSEAHRQNRSPLAAELDLAARMETTDLSDIPSSSSPALATAAARPAWDKSLADRLTISSVTDTASTGRPRVLDVTESDLHPSPRIPGHYHRFTPYPPESLQETRMRDWYPLLPVKRCKCVPFRILTAHRLHMWFHVLIPLAGLAARLANPWEVGHTDDWRWLICFSIMCLSHGWTFVQLYMHSDNILFWKVARTFDFFVVSSAALIWQVCSALIRILDAHPDIGVLLVRDVYLNAVTVALYVLVFMVPDTVTFFTPRFKWAMVSIGTFLLSFSLYRSFNEVSPDHTWCLSSNRLLCTSLYSVRRVAIVQLLLFVMKFGFRAWLHGGSMAYLQSNHIVVRRKV